MTGAPDGPFVLLTAWLLTFAVHSTLLLLAAWVIARSRSSEPLQELLWRTALFGGLFTASLQLALVQEPVAGHVALLGPVAVTVTEHLPGDADRVDDRAAAAGAALPARAVPGAPRAGPAARSGRAADASARDWLAYAATLAAAAAAALATMLSAGRRARLRRALADRRVLSEGSWHDALQRFRSAAGYRRSVVLSASAHIASPIAFGVLRPEICVPERALADLGPREAEGLLAHELAHLARNDPLVLQACGWLECAFPWQLLFRLARQRLYALAEYRCDSIAADLAGSRSVAQCLVEIAGWLASPRAARPAFAPSAALPGMAATGSALGRRVRRLLADGARPRTILRGRWFAPAALSLLAATTIAAPGASLRTGNTGDLAVQAAPAGDLAAHGIELPPPRADSPPGPVDLLDDEYAALMQEVAALAAHLDGVVMDQELRALARKLRSRVERLDRLRARIETLAEQLSAAGADSYHGDAATK